MNFKKYSNVVYFLLVGFIVYIIFTLMKGNIKENFGNSKEISEDIKITGNEIEDKLLVSNYRKDYENIIIGLDDVISTTILSEVCKNAQELANKPLGNNSLDQIRNINDLKAFKDTLNDAMKTLDKK